MSACGDRSRATCDALLVLLSNLQASGHSFCCVCVSCTLKIDPISLTSRAHRRLSKSENFVAPSASMNRRNRPRACNIPCSRTLVYNQRFSTHLLHCAAFALVLLQRQHANAIRAVLARVAPRDLIRRIYSERANTACLNDSG